MSSKLLGYSSLNPGIWADHGNLGYYYVNGTASSAFVSNLPASITSMTTNRFETFALDAGNPYSMMLPDGSGRNGFGWRSGSTTAGNVITLGVNGSILCSFCVVVYNNTTIPYAITVEVSSSSGTESLAMPSGIAFPWLRVAMWGTDTVQVKISNPSSYPRYAGYLVDDILPDGHFIL